MIYFFFKETDKNSFKKTFYEKKTYTVMVKHSTQYQRKEKSPLI